MGLTVFVVVSGEHFLQYVEVGGISRLGYPVFGYRLLDSASRLTGMPAVAVSAVVGSLEYFRKEMACVFSREVDSPEASYSGNVDYLPAIWKVEHL